jgi:hypothetical protein
MKKKKRNLFSTFESIERFHRRRSVLTIHVVFSLALQIAVWANWYGSYAQFGNGFKDNFFTDRISISLALALAGHFVLMVLRESRDRLVVEALRQHQDELEMYETDDAASAAEMGEELALTETSDKLRR